ncbi:hypothetical protein SAMN05880582_101662 [Rhizobium sp. RU20A]|uniref:hypothetical protein n=1 Tax=Rhizobium sp. RU20A TaxID=1907412 RepID=UPI0009544FDC|nr:hypothetical protein [Rhizobium sp. RU20A]SIQ08365.1 hypothetical protein SAMN05880582_101662 [Rhizobium sp. RU20A]
MSFKTGIHFFMGWSGKASNLLTDNLPPLIFFHPTESETMTKPGVSKLVGPATHSRWGSAIVRITAAQDSFVAIGQDPEAENAPKALVLAGQTMDLVLTTNQKIAWSLA